MNVAAPLDDTWAGVPPVIGRSLLADQGMYLRHAMLRLALLLRIVPLSQAALTVLVGARIYRDVWPGVAAVAVAIGWSCFAARSLWRSSGSQAWLHAADGVVAAVLLVAVAANLPPVLLTTSFYWPATLLNAVMLMLGVSLPWYRGAFGLLLPAAYLAVVVHGAGAQALPLATANGLASVIYWVFGLVIAARTARLQLAIGRLDRDERRQQQALSVQRTRLEEFARLHDEAVQILERAAAEEPPTPALRRFALSAALGLSGVADRHAPGAAGLAASLEDVAARFAAFGFAVDIELAADLAGPADPVQASVLVASVTEALNNAYKHSGATCARIVVTEVEGGTSALVYDGGTGFDSDTITPGFGLAYSLHGRVAQAGGQVSVRSVPHGGTVVDIWLPWPPRLPREFPASA